MKKSWVREGGESTLLSHRLSQFQILETTWGEKQVLPLGKLSSMAEFIERFPAMKAATIDGTKRPVQRPKDPERQTEYSSGKKKRHTHKPITVSTSKKRVIITL